jgi:hypothetical protein
MVWESKKIFGSEMKRILQLITLLAVCMAASGQATSFHRPALSDDPMRHLNPIESKE